MSKEQISENIKEDIKIAFTKPLCLHALKVIEKQYTLPTLQEFMALHGRDILLHYLQH